MNDSNNETRYIAYQASDRGDANYTYTYPNASGI